MFTVGLIQILSGKKGIGIMIGMVNAALIDSPVETLEVILLNVLHTKEGPNPFPWFNFTTRSLPLMVNWSGNPSPLISPNINELLATVLDNPKPASKEPASIFTPNPAPAE